MDNIEIAEAAFKPSLNERLAITESAYKLLLSQERTERHEKTMRLRQARIAAMLSGQAG